MTIPQNDIDPKPFNLFDNKQALLFDSMRRLSELKVSKKIETPQLIVVGAQSSGKSSVLEALVRCHFPVDDVKPTTRFPIKLDLRKADHKTIKVEIEPGITRPLRDHDRLLSLAKTLSSVQDFNTILKRAKAELQVSTVEDSNGGSANVRTFCDDTLVVEHCDPSLPQLSLIDLPGVFSATSEEQTPKDREMIDKMVRKHISCPRNIILLVLSATVRDFNGYTALGMVQDEMIKNESLKRRVICVVTSPDAAASLENTQKLLGKESQFSSCFDRPWHVLCNQDQKARENHQSLDERDKKEQEFFSKKSWEAIPSSQKGITSLRETLKSMICLQIRDQLPYIISEVKTKISEENARLDSTVRERATPEARRAYLSDIAERFSFLTREAVKGTYENEGCDKNHDMGETCQDCEGFFARFGENGSDDQKKRLRANVRALNQAFSITMLQYGKTEVEHDYEGTATPPSMLNPVAKPCRSRVQYFQPEDTAKYYKQEEPKLTTRKEYEDLVNENMSRWTSKGPRGEPSDGAYSGLFAHQAKKWGPISVQHVTAVWKVVEDFISLALNASCSDDGVRAQLLGRLVNRHLHKLRLAANKTLRHLIRCHEQCNTGFYDSIVDASAIREHARALLQQLTVTGLENEDNSEPITGASATTTATSTEQASGQPGGGGGAQQTHAQRHAEPKPKTQPVNSQRSGEQRPKERNQRSQEAFLTSTENFLSIAMQSVAGYALGGAIPIRDNSRVWEPMVSMMARRLMTMSGISIDSGNKEKSKRPEENFQSVLDAMYPSNFENISAARIIAQVELHYEVRDFESNTVYSSPISSLSVTLIIITTF